MLKTRRNEFYQLERLLRILGQARELELAVRVEHRDRPDFVLSTASTNIGVEVTSYSDEEVHRADYLAKTRFPNAFIPNAFTTRRGLHGTSKDQIIDAMFDWETPGEDIIEADEYLVGKILEKIQLKRGKLRSSTFEKFHENWLLLCDYANPFPTNWITDEIFTRRFSTACRCEAVIGTEFDRIYILCGCSCFRVGFRKSAYKLAAACS
jgi:hypothetical protein